MIFFVSMNINLYDFYNPKNEFEWVLKGAGAFHSAGQSKEGNLVLALPSIRFAWNFYQIISGTKYE